MIKKNSIGLENVAISPIIEKLNIILADYHIFYANLRGLHWNIKGDKFFELHELYEEYYNETAEKIDETAERILQLGGIPANTFSQYLKQATIKELDSESNWEKGLNNVLTTLQELTQKHRDLLAAAIKANDNGTMSLAGHAIKDYEKKIWMLTAYLAE